MDLKSFSDFNKIVIIDDIESEGRKVQEALEKVQISSLFIRAERSKLPKEPFGGVRMVFMDLEMIQGVSARAVAAHAFQYLSRVVQPKSYYVLVFWSSFLQGQVKDELLDILEKNPDMKPCVPPIPLSKTKALLKDGSYSPYKINTMLRKGITKASAHTVFFNWSNIVDQSIAQFLIDFLGDGNKRDATTRMHALASSYAGASYEADIPKNAFLALNDVLKGVIDAEITKKDFSDVAAYLHRRPRKKLDRKEIANFNYSLMINPNVDQVGPGCVYKVESSFGRGLVRRGGGAISVAINVTPLCDAAQNKNKFNYFIYGLLAPDGCEVHDYGYIYGIDNPFMYKGKTYRLAINLKSLSSELSQSSAPTTTEKRIESSSGNEVEVVSQTPLLAQTDKIIFKLRDPIVLDIQHKLSSHISRPGHTFL